MLYKVYSSLPDVSTVEGCVCGGGGVGVREARSVIVLHPLLRPLNDLLQVPLQVVGGVAGELVNDLLFVSLHGLFIDRLEDLTLDVVLKLLS